MTGQLKKFYALPIALVGLGLVPATSLATLTIETGNLAPHTELNIEQANGTTGTVFTAGTSSLGSVIRIDTNGVRGQVQGGGSASIIPVSTNFMTVDFSSVSPYVGWEAISINPGFPNFDDGTEFTVFGYDQNGTEYSEDFVIQNGNNRFRILSDTMQYITGVSITTAPESLITGITQIRVGDLVRGQPSVVPEPSTLALAIGCIAPIATIGLIRRRRQAKSDAA